ncbi:MAG TPA: hypothetical protein VGC91_00395 [Pyrinomonadaceae bacterium]
MGRNETASGGQAARGATRHAFLSRRKLKDSHLASKKNTPVEINQFASTFGL